MFSLEFTEDQLQIRDLARKFAEEEIATTVIDRDINSIFPVEILQKLAELGFLGITTPAEWGGSGMDYISYTLAITEIAKVDASVAIVLSVQNSLVNWILEKYGSDYLKEKYLRKLAEGTFLGSYCLSEPDTGSDARQITTRATFVDGMWVLSGAKNWISTAIHANVHIVFAQTDPSLEHRGMAAFLVESGTEGFEIGKKEDKMGMRSSETCSIGLNDVKIPAENLIGEVGQGFYIAMAGLTGGRIGIASQALGIAKGAFEASVKYARQRFTMGKPIADHQLIQQKIAQMSMKIDAAELLLLKAAWLRDMGMEHSRLSSEAKLFASTTAFDVAREAIQIHGGYGYVREYQVERMLRDAKVTEIYEGTSEIQHIVIARDVFKNDFI